MNAEFLSQLVAAWTYEVTRSISVSLAKLECRTIDPSQEQCSAQFQRILPAVVDMFKRLDLPLMPPSDDRVDMLVYTLAELIRDAGEEDAAETTEDELPPPPPGEFN